MSQITSSTRKKFFLNVDAEIPSGRTGYPSSSEGFQEERDIHLAAKAFSVMNQCRRLPALLENFLG